MDRPEFVEQMHLEFLYTLQDSNAVNMNAAGVYLSEAFDLDRKDAHKILRYWMDNWSESESRKRRNEDG